MLLMGDRKGFTLVELMVVMLITIFVLAATSKILVSLITTFKQQSKIAETSIESIVGLEILRRDIQSAGFGLASGIGLGISTYSVTGWTDVPDYTESTNPTGADPHPNFKPEDFNDTSPKKPPRAFVSSSPGWTLNDSVYFVIKGANLGDTAAAGKFHTLEIDGPPNTWMPQKDDPTLDANLRPDDYVMVISIRDKNNVGLVRDFNNGNQYYTQFKSTINYEPPDNEEVRIIYGLDSYVKPRAPFNRSDYYISDIDTPERCSAGTGTLTKATMQHSDGKSGSEMPLLDCVADFQVIYGLDTDNNGTVDDPTDSLVGLSARDIRDQVKEVRLFILAHEGQADPRRKFYPDPANEAITTLKVGPLRTFDFAADFDATVGTTWQNYKWRVLKVAETPSAMR